MKYFLGIDGGGTKTAISLGNEYGEEVCSIITSGCSYQSIGVEAVVTLIQTGVEALLQKQKLSSEDCRGCCIGLPCYGENPDVDGQLEKLLTDALFPISITIVNDAVVGWAGSLACQEGIHLVAGTGSIAIGYGRDGTFARCGGWTEFFGDEGSCYWIGREGMSLFSKQADGRAPKAALYSLVKNVWNLAENFDFIDKILKDIAPSREKTAAFQRYVLEAANAGDVEAQKIYGRAAKELGQIVAGVRFKLKWSEETVPVSYYGGLFHAGHWILEPLTKEMEAIGCTIQKPLRSAAEGALLLAIKEFNKKEEKKCF